MGDAGHRVDTAEPSILALLKVDTARGEDGGILIKEVIGSEQEADSVPQSHCVGDILGMGDMQEAGCNPSHQVLREEGQAERLRGGETQRTTPPQPQSPTSRLSLASTPTQPRVHTASRVILVRSCRVVGVPGLISPKKDDPRWPLNLRTGNLTIPSNLLSGAGQPRRQA